MSGGWAARAGHEKPVGEPESFLPRALQSEEGGRGSVGAGRQCPGCVARVTVAVLCLLGPWACWGRGGPALGQGLTRALLPLTCPMLSAFPSRDPAGVCLVDSSWFSCPPSPPGPKSSHAGLPGLGFLFNTKKHRVFSYLNVLAILVI